MKSKGFLLHNEIESMSLFRSKIIGKKYVASTAIFFLSYTMKMLLVIFVKTAGIDELLFKGLYSFYYCLS